MMNAGKAIKNKMGLIILAEKLENVSKACKIIGYSRDSFYRFNGSIENHEYLLYLVIEDIDPR
jgi:ACT domain-containing protein